MEKTIIVHLPKKEQGRLTHLVTKVLASYDAFALVQATDQQIAGLREQNIPLDIQEDIDSIQIGGDIIDTTKPGVGLRPPGPGERTLREHPAGTTTPPLPGRHHYIVQFIGPIKEEWKKAVADLGGILCAPLPPYAYIVEMDEGAVDAVQALPIVRWVGHYAPQYRLSRQVRRITRQADGESPRRQGEVAASPLGGRRSRASHLPTSFVVRFFDATSLRAAIPQIEALGATVAPPESPDATVLAVTFPPAVPGLGDKLQQIAALHGVNRVDQQVLRQPFCNVATRLMNVDRVAGNSPGLGLTGKGEVIALADTGLDSGDPTTIHPDFYGRVRLLTSWPISPAYDPLVTNPGANDGPADAHSSHGTHVTGCAAGDGTASRLTETATIRGVAPEAEIIFQAVEQYLAWRPEYVDAYRRMWGQDPEPWGLAGLPVDLTALFQEAYDHGARIHSNSWGGGGYGEYDDYAAAVDAFVWTHKDMVILFAAGNDGRDSDGNGYVDFGTVTPPGTAKNCITVGASENLRPGQAAANGIMTWGQAWPADFPAPPLRDDPLADAADDIAGFSSRGPTRDGRIKPDVVAPGTFILSTLSQAVEPERRGLLGWAPYAPNSAYFFDGGTSMACPLVAGAIALLRQRLRRRRPSAALVKALLIHGAVRRPYRYSAETTPGSPSILWDYEQGWGHVDLNNTLLPQPPRKVRLIDFRRGVQTGESWRMSVTISDPSIPFKVTLAWSDYPAMPGQYPCVVNDLSLIVLAPNGRIYLGDAAGPPISVPGRRGRDNVQAVIIPAPLPGAYQVSVRGNNVPQGPQDFALVISGGLR